MYSVVTLLLNYSHKYQTTQVFIESWAPWNYSVQCKIVHYSTVHLQYCFARICNAFEALPFWIKDATFWVFCKLFVCLLYLPFVNRKNSRHHSELFLMYCSYLFPLTRFVIVCHVTGLLRERERAPRGGEGRLGKGHK